MKNYKYIIGLLIFLCNISCKKSFLDVPSKNILLRQAYVTNLKTTGDFLNGVYVELGMNFYYGTSLIYPELVADNLKISSGFTFLRSHYNWLQIADDNKSTQLLRETNMNPIWYNGYKIIRDCSFVLECADKYKGEDPNKSDDIKGQAYALRAMMHYVLVNIFSQPYNFTQNASHLGVPYVMTSDWSQIVSRNTVNEVYSNMISDLNNAIAVLPKIPTTVALNFKNLVFNLNAAKALLSRVYLYKGDYSNSKNLAKEVAAVIPISSSAEYPKNLFTLQESEALFQLPPAASGVAGSAGNYATTFSGFFYTTPVLVYQATSDIAVILKENSQDSRSKWVNQDGSNWNVSKFPSNVIPNFPSQSASYYQTLIRSSEMYLNAAESYAQLNMRDSAIYYLDAIRMRACPSLPPTNAMGSALLDSIYKERRKELAFEGFRMFDLMRWKKEVYRNDAPNPAARVLPYGSNKALAPIPISDVTISGIEQNPDY